MAKNTENKSAPKKKNNEKPGFAERFKRWYKNLFKQLKAVSWPGSEKTKRNTGTVLGVILIFALTIFIFDKAVAFLFEVTGFYGADAKPVNVVQTQPITKDVLEQKGITEATSAGEKDSESTADKEKASEQTSEESSAEAVTESTSGN